MSLSFLYEDSSLVSSQDRNQLLEKLKPEITRMALMRTNGYSQPSDFINLPFDTEYHDTIIQLAEEKRALDPKLLLLIGIGGSNLGAVAVHEALHGQFYNNKNPDIAFYSADTLDADKIKDLQVIVEQILKQGENVLIVVVTKSGTTTETTVNAALFIQLLKRYKPDDYQSYCVMITDKDSALERYGHDIGSAILEIPQSVGGRYSVFSAVGLFPLAVLGVDIKALCKGAADMVTVCTKMGKENFAAESAVTLFYHYKNGAQIHDTFFFDAAHESLGKWYRQLMAESLGKQRDIAGNDVENGMMPTVSIGTVDLHSMVQLYLGGPRTRFTTFVAVDQDDNTAIPKSSITKAGGRKILVVQYAIFKGVQEAYLKAQRPFLTILGLKKDAGAVGAFLQCKMLEIVYCGFLMHVNSFDQPEVELYKKEVRKVLGGE